MVDVTRDRHLFIGGSDAYRIFSGDWHKLWQEKTGLIEPENLDQVFKVQLGKHTEEFHLDWISRLKDFSYEKGGERWTSATHDFLACHVDGWISKPGPTCPAEWNDLPIEVKHTGSHANHIELAQFYMPQLQHNMNVTDTKAILFSAIIGNEEPVPVIVNRSQDYIDRLVEMEVQFWWHVTNKVEPGIIPSNTALKIETEHVTIDGMHDENMTGHNQWADEAAIYLENEAAAAAFEQAKKNIKELVPSDVRKAYGHGLEIRRDSRGSLRIYKEKA